MPGSTYIKAKKAHHTNASPTRLPYTLTYPTLTARFTLHYTYQPLPSQPTLYRSLPYTSPQPTYPTPAYLPYTTYQHHTVPPKQPTLHLASLQVLPAET
jgi:hypothetical protein